MNGVSAREWAVDDWEQQMVSVAVVYSSGGGHTRTVAEHVCLGIDAFPGASCELIEIVSGQLGNNGRWHDADVTQRLAAADAIVFGAPTYMGSAHGLFKLFLDAAIAPWLHQDWKDKIAGGFTNSSSRSGDKLMTIEQFAVFAAQMGMVWVGVGDPPGGNFAASRYSDVNVNGGWLGLITQSFGDGTPETAPHEGDRLTAERFGRRIARTASRWQMGAVSFPMQPVTEAEAKRRNVAGPDEWRRFEDREAPLAISSS